MYGTSSRTGPTVERMKHVTCGGRAGQALHAWRRRATPRALGLLGFRTSGKRSSRAAPAAPPAHPHPPALVAASSAGGGMRRLHRAGRSGAGGARVVISVVGGPRARPPTTSPAPTSRSAPSCCGRNCRPSAPRRRSRRRRRCAPRKQPRRSAWRAVRRGAGAGAGGRARRGGRRAGEGGARGGGALRGERVVAVQTAVEEVAHDFAIEPELVAPRG